MSHASTLFGCVMVIHGGYCGEDKHTLDDFDLFDLCKIVDNYLFLVDSKKWVHARFK